VETVEDTYENDPGRWGASLRNVRELLIPCLEARGARTVLEVGAYAGDLTGLLLDWADSSGARISAIDPEPPDELDRLLKARPELELIRATSHEALAGLEKLPDAVIIDGDHNYFTVSEELRLIADRSADQELPLLLFHDVAWPHARRDTYYEPERIPPEGRQPMTTMGGVAPDDPGLTPRGLTYPWVADQEGGPRNGVLTAIEDFLADRSHLRCAVVPVFFGFGVVWPQDASWAPGVESVLAGWDRNPLLARLEANRVYHLTVSHATIKEVMNLRARVHHQETLLRSMLESRAFAIGERLSQLHQRERPAFSRRQVREVLGDTESDSR
jgi:hypothetical protein